MVFPIIIFLYIYLAFFVIWLVFSLAGVYHILKFSQISLISFFSLILYTAGSFVILSTSYFFISHIDWSTPIPYISNLITISFN